MTDYDRGHSAMVSNMTKSPRKPLPPPTSFAELTERQYLPAGTELITDQSLREITSAIPGIQISEAELGVIVRVWVGRNHNEYRFNDAWPLPSEQRDKLNELYHRADLLLRGLNDLDGFTRAWLGGSREDSGPLAPYIQNIEDLAFIRQLTTLRDQLKTSSGEVSGTVKRRERFSRKLTYLFMSGAWFELAEMWTSATGGRKFGGQFREFATLCLSAVVGPDMADRDVERYAKTAIRTFNKRAKSN